MDIEKSFLIEKKKFFFQQTYQPASIKSRNGGQTA